MEPTERNIRRMRLLSMKGIKTVEIPVIKDHEFQANACIPPTPPEFETVKINVEDWLLEHDPALRTIQ